MIDTPSRLRAVLSLATASAALMTLAVLALGAAPAIAVRGHIFTGSFGSPGSGPGQLGEPAGLAVNEATGDIYYLDKTNNRVEIFNATGSKFEGEFNGSGLGLGILGSGQLLNEGKAAGGGGLPEEVPSGRFDEPVEIAVDNDPSSPSFGDVYVADTRGHKVGVGSTSEEQVEEARRVVDKFSADGEYIGQITTNPNGGPFSGKGQFREIFGVAVDSQGEVWVEEINYGSSRRGAANYTNAVANAWIGFRPTESAAFFDGANLFAVDSKDNIYLNHFIYTDGNGTHIEPIGELNAGGELIDPEVDGEEPTGVAVEHSSNDVYIGHLTNVHRLDATGKSLENLTVPGGHGSSVAVDAATLTVYAVDSAAGVVDVFGPEAPGVPTVSSGSESVEDVTATSASFSGEVNPRSESFEEATSYSFEYGPCDTPTTCSSSPYVDSVPAPAGVLAANYEPDGVSAHPQDLSAHTAYHMRLVAHNSHPGVAEGEELLFTTQATGTFVSPDSREWELVSPADKYGALIQASNTVSQASVDGGAITYNANGPIEAQPPGNSNSFVQAIAARGPSGWRSLNISAPHEAAGGGLDYPFFSSDLSMALLRPTGALIPSLSSDASEQTAFLRSDFAGGGDSTGLCTSSCYTPLVTSNNVPPGTVFGRGLQGEECVTGIGVCGPQFVGGSLDAKHIVLQYSWAPLVEGAPVGSLYEWTGGRLSVVSVLPDESPVAGGVLGTVNKEAGGSGTEEMVRNAVSADGSRVVWSYASHLYLRDMVREKTVQLDEVQGGSGEGSSGPAFQTASSDGSRVFFIDSQRLTKDASGPSDLYECEIVEEAGELKCLLTDLTGGGGESAGVIGSIPGASENGSYVYFVASGVLTGAELNERGERAIAGQHNLYVRHAGVTSLIAVLSGEDSTDFTLQPKHLTARVSANGNWLSFMSDRSLTDFDNRDVVSGERDEEVFLYHAGESDDGTLVCASCDPTGARPYGVFYAGSPLGGNADGPHQTFGPGAQINVQWAAAVVPGWTSRFYQARYLSDSGRLFFDSFDALVPQDTNGAEDVYQYEPTGVGDCTASSATFARRAGGCIGLISAGTSKKDSVFFDASESGGDVFFLTTARLSSQDIDSAVDIYDAHECHPGETCLPPVGEPVPACEGDACQSPVAAPEDPTPGSLTYQGPGNPVSLLSPGEKPKAKSKPSRCKKGFVKSHGRCVKRKTRKVRRGTHSANGTRAKNAATTSGRVG